MPSRYLIAFDLDGTLLNNHGEVSSNTKNILNKLYENNHLLVIVTGRPQSACMDICEQLNFKIPIISYNGALIYCENSSFEESNLIDHTILHQIINGINMDLINNILITDKDNLFQYKKDPYLPNLFEKSKLPITNATLSKTKGGMSLLINYKNNNETPILEYLKQYNKHISIRFWPDNNNIIEVQKKSVTKAFGIEILRERHGIIKENTIAFGDQNNDISMIEHAAIGVAMENACPELKSVATNITLSNEKEGVYTFLKNYFYDQV